MFLLIVLIKFVKMTEGDKSALRIKLANMILSVIVAHDKGTIYDYNEDIDDVIFFIEGLIKNNNNDRYIT